MARLEDRLLNHPVHGSINDLRATLTGLADETVETANETCDGALSRAPKVLTFIEGALAAADPTLVAASTLEAINSAVTQANQTASQLMTHPQYAETFDTHIEQALSAAAQLVASSPLVAERAAGAAETLDTALTETVKSVSQRAEDLAADLAKLEGARAETDALREDRELQREQEFTTKVDELRAHLSTEKQRLDSLVPNFEKQFSSDQDARQVRSIGVFAPSVSL